MMLLSCTMVVLPDSSLQIIFVSKQVICPARDIFFHHMFMLNMSVLQ